MTIEQLIKSSYEQSTGQFFETYRRFVEDNIEAQSVADEHLYFDGVCTFVRRNHRMPSSSELASECFDEWDDPITAEQAKVFLEELHLVAAKTVD